jgi:hypothetical protein
MQAYGTLERKKALLSQGFSMIEVNQLGYSST